MKANGLSENVHLFLFFEKVLMYLVTLWSNFLLKKYIYIEYRDYIDLETVDLSLFWFVRRYLKILGYYSRSETSSDSCFARNQ